MALLPKNLGSHTPKSINLHFLEIHDKQASAKIWTYRILDTCIQKEEKKNVK